MVVSVGWNPFYQNEKKTMVTIVHIPYDKSSFGVVEHCLVWILQETYIMHNFQSDFYGSELRVCIVGFIREMDNYSSVGRKRLISKLLLRNTAECRHWSLVLSVHRWADLGNQQWHRLRNDWTREEGARNPQNSFLLRGFVGLLIPASTSSPWPRFTICAHFSFFMIRLDLLCTVTTDLVSDRVLIIVCTFQLCVVCMFMFRLTWRISRLWYSYKRMLKQYLKQISTYMVNYTML